MREAGPNPLAARELPPGREGVVERPPPGLARGVFAVSPPVVTLVSVACLLLALAYYAIALIKIRRR
jgi:hypothetical protein